MKNKQCPGSTQTDYSRISAGGAHEGANLKSFAAYLKVWPGAELLLWNVGIKITQSSRLPSPLFLAQNSKNSRRENLNGPVYIQRTLLKKISHCQESRVTLDQTWQMAPTSPCLCIRAGWITENWAATQKLSIIPPMSVMGSFMLKQFSLLYWEHTQIKWHHGVQIAVGQPGMTPKWVQGCFMHP